FSFTKIGRSINLELASITSIIFLSVKSLFLLLFFFFQAEDGIRDFHVTGVQTCAIPILVRPAHPDRARAVRPLQGDRRGGARRPDAVAARPERGAAAGLGGPRHPEGARGRRRGGRGPRRGVRGGVAGRRPPDSPCTRALH